MGETTLGGAKVASDRLEQWEEKKKITEQNLSCRRYSWMEEEERVLRKEHTRQTAVSQIRGRKETVQMKGKGVGHCGDTYVKRPCKRRTKKSLIELVFQVTM